VTERDTDPKHVTVSNISRVIRSRKIRWAEFAAHMEEMENIYKILV
jgi:hypothetical protein